MCADIASELVTASSLQEYDRLLLSAKMGVGWNKPEPSMYPAPEKRFIPAHWSYCYARAALFGAARLLRIEDSQRRNLIMANPVPGNTEATARSIVAAYQMIQG